MENRFQILFHIDGLVKAQYKTDDIRALQQTVQVDPV